MDYLDPFEKRRKENIAEKILIDKYKDDEDVLIIKYGLDLLHVDMPMNLFCKISNVIRKTPDYIMVSKKGSGAYFVEAKGCKMYLKLKLEDLVAYSTWHRTMSSEMDLLIFVYDSNTRTDTFITLHRLKYLINKHKYKVKEFFDNKKRYYEIPYADIKI